MKKLFILLSLVCLFPLVKAIEGSSSGTEMNVSVVTTTVHTPPGPVGTTVPIEEIEEIIREIKFRAEVKEHQTTTGLSLGLSAVAVTSYSVVRVFKYKWLLLHTRVRTVWVGIIVIELAVVSYNLYNYYQFVAGY